MPRGPVPQCLLLFAPLGPQPPSAPPASVSSLPASCLAGPCRYAYDWDNVFWPLNLLLAQETDRSTFRQQTELFLKNWICAGNAANYTARGRAYNPFSGELPLGSCGPTPLGALGMVQRPRSQLTSFAQPALVNTGCLCFPQPAFSMH